MLKIGSIFEWGELEECELWRFSYFHIAKLVWFLTTNIFVGTLSDLLSIEEEWKKYEPLKKFCNSSLNCNIIYCYFIIIGEYDIIRKLDCSSLQWCAICNAYAIMECAVLKNIQQGQKLNVAKFLIFDGEFPYVWRWIELEWCWCGDTWKFTHGVFSSAYVDEICLD